MDDFTICNGCGGADVGRREFISKSALAAAALLLAACASDSATGPDLSGSASIKISDYPALASVNGAAAFTLSGSPIAVVRTGATSFVALSRVCPHQGGLIVANGTSAWRCTEHGAMFNLTGTWTGGERTSNMRSYATSYNATTDTLTIG